MKCRMVWLAACLALNHGTALRAQTISWFSDAKASNLDSSGAPMDGAFEFRLGVFANGYEPTAGNAASWSGHWTSAQTTSYDPVNRRFSQTHSIGNNTPPFTAGADGWIFGRRDGSTGSEWILFRAGDWSWPEVSPIFPPSYDWDAGEATQVVLGTIHAGGSPHLMRSALVRSYAQWRTAYLTGEPHAEPGDDPDRDGMPNLLEFVFGTAPQTANAPVATPVTLDAGRPVISVPRRIDHLAVLTVEVSGNLTDWNSGPGFTQELQNDAAALVVRDLTAVSPANPRRFIRLKATLP